MKNKNVDWNNNEKTIMNINNITSEKDLTQFLSFMIEKLGWGFHPDNPIEDYVNIQDGTLSFNPEKAKNLENLMEQLFDFCKQNGIDIYEKSMEICTEMHGDIFEMLHQAYRG